MKALAITGAAILLIVLMLGGWIMVSYNSLITGDQAANQAWSQVETQYQRRFDLIPNLVAATQGAMKQEQKVFGDIAEARTRYAGSAAGSNDRVAATNQYDSAISRLLLVMENYPTLKSLDNVKALADELAGTENRVLVARDRYNAQVQQWNVQMTRFPGNLMAGMFGFHTREFFKADEGSQAAPKVDLTI